MLISVANNLLKYFNNSAIIARQGGDEFIVVKQYKNKEEIELFKSQIENAFNEITIPNYPQLKVKCSIGAAVYSEALDLKNLIKIADYRMYDIKRNKI